MFELVMCSLTFFVFLFWCVETSSSLSNITPRAIHAVDSVNDVIIINDTDNDDGDYNHNDNGNNDNHHDNSNKK